MTLPVHFSSLERLRPAVLNVRPVDMTFVKENIVQLPLIDHRSAHLALIEVPFLRFVQLVKVSGVHSLCHSFHLFWWFDLFNCDVASEHAAPINADVDLFVPLTGPSFHSHSSL